MSFHLARRSLGFVAAPEALVQQFERGGPVATSARIAHRRAVNDEPQNFNVPTWKFVTALVVVLIAVLLGTMLWMWRDTKPRRRPALLGAPEVVRTNPPPVVR